MYIVGCVYEAVDIKHQRLVGACLFSGDAGENAVELGMGVELWVLCHRQAADVRNCGEADGAWDFGL